VNSTTYITVWPAQVCTHLLPRSLDHRQRRLITLRAGQRGYERKGGGRALEWSLSNPWDVASHGHYLYIAMAGTHQIWKYNEKSTPQQDLFVCYFFLCKCGLKIDFLTGVAFEGEEISLVSGSGSELNFNHDDDILQSGWAQPSGALVPQWPLHRFITIFTRHGVFHQD
jgi:hypothetical protein